MTNPTSALTLYQAAVDDGYTFYPDSFFNRPKDWYVERKRRFAEVREAIVRDLADISDEQIVEYTGADYECEKLPLSQASTYLRDHCDKVRSWARYYADEWGALVGLIYILRSASEAESELPDIRRRYIQAALKGN